MRIQFKKLIVACAAMAAIFAGASEGTAAVVIGSWDGGNCYPFSCGASDNVTTYQQIYNSSEFSGPLTFSSISFFLDPNFPGEMDSATYTVSFSTTAAAFGSMSSTLADNVGADSALFGVFSLGGAMPTVLTLVGSAFSYDPGDGHLLMNVEISGLTEDHGYESFFKADYTGIETQRNWAIDGDAIVVANDTGALVTEFGDLAEVPEPSTLVLFGLGGIGLAFVAKRRRQTTTV